MTSNSERDAFEKWRKTDYDCRDVINNRPWRAWQAARSHPSPVSERERVLVEAATYSEHAIVCGINPNQEITRSGEIRLFGTLKDKRRARVALGKLRNALAAYTPEQEKQA